MNDRLKALSDAGVSIWLDDLSRERIETGNLEELITEKSVVGVTTNPTIFASAIANGERYDEQVGQLVDKGESVERVVFELTTEDVRNACDIFARWRNARRPTDGSRSRSSDLANDTEGTMASARALWAAVDRQNVLIKIPPPRRACPPSPRRSRRDQRQRDPDLQPRALPRGHGRLPVRPRGGPRRGLDLSRIRSVASFFVSRVDTEVDKRLDALSQGDGGEEATALKGKAAVANARLAYAAYQEVVASERWRGSPMRAPTSSGRLGVDRRQERGLPGHALRQRARRPGHAQYDAGEDPGGVRPRRGGG